MSVLDPITRDALFRPIAGAIRLRLWASACLAARSGEAACARCARSCPVGALRIGEAGPAAAGACLGCGRCAAACPTGALVTKGFEASETLPHGNAAVVVECWKVPARHCTQGARRVPCLGGLGLAALLEAATAGVRLVDRGWCSDCRAGGGAGHPAQAAAALANRALRACGLGEERLVRFERRPLPAPLMPLDIPGAAGPPSPMRRGFLLRLSAAEREATRSPVAPRPRLRREPMPLPGRERVLAAAERLAARAGRPVPAFLRPVLSLSECCSGHGICAAVCPTGALRKTDAAHASRLTFDAAACVGCALCARLCPEGALALGEPPAHAGAPAAPIVLKAFAVHACSRCGAAFVDAPQEKECRDCRTRASLARNLFGSLLAQSSAEPTPIAYDNRRSPR